MEPPDEALDPPDKTMEPVFGDDTLRMCHMMKHLKEHLTSVKK